MFNAIFDRNDSRESLEATLNFFGRIYFCLEVDYIPSKDRKNYSLVLARAKSNLSNLKSPSIFKKVAVLTHEFVRIKPVSCCLPVDFYPAGVKTAKEKRCHHNAVLALAFAIELLDGAQIKRSDGKIFTLDRIDLSDHQKLDFEMALKLIDGKYELVTRLLAITFESLAYEFNDNVRYEKKTRLIGSNIQSIIQGGSSSTYYPEDNPY